MGKTASTVQVLLNRCTTLRVCRRLILAPGCKQCPSGIPAVTWRLCRRGAWSASAHVLVPTNVCNQEIGNWIIFV
ncbi:hypothetical protein COCSUDRAFT_33603, partial [Coccomyxa subellipsoidea C-169]